MSNSIPAITEADIRELSSPEVFERGVGYYEGGALFDTRQMGDELHARCHGSSYAPYRVSAQLGPGGVVDAACSCPYDWGGICKHVVALLLAWVRSPEVFHTVAPVELRLAGKGKEALIALIGEMLRREPDLERLLDLPLHADPEDDLDLDPFRRQIEYALLGEFPDPDALAFELAAIAETGDRFAASGNWTAAGAIFHLTLSEIIPIYGQLYDEDGDVARVLQRCAAGLGRGLQQGEPDSAARQSWLEVLLEAEFKDIQMGGIDLAYPAREILIEHATDDEWQHIEARVRAMLPSLESHYSSWGRESLVTLLAVRLEQSGRETEIPDLIFELGSEAQRAFELVRQGRFAEAISIAEEHFVDLPGRILQFADTLVEAGAISEAMAYVTGQLEAGPRSAYSASDWLAKTAEKQQDLQAALEWRLRIFRASPQLESYRKLREVARQLDQWRALRPGLIRDLESGEHWDALIAIALEEGEVARAIELLPRQQWGQYDLQVARAAEKERPNAAIEIYCRRVEELIEARGRENYREAAAVLKRVQALYRRQGTGADWDRLLADLRQRHARLPALMDELKKAGL